MNKLRVFQNVNQRKTVQPLSKRGICTVFLLFLFLPYIISALCGNGQEAEEASALAIRLQTGSIQVINCTALGREEIPLEIYVADKLARCMDNSYEVEALKAQAVLIRTNLIKEGAEDIFVEDDRYGSVRVTGAYYLAAAETKGLILEYEEKPVYGAYFKSSSGYTRDAKESLPGEAHPYLTGVPCERDYMADGYYSTLTYAKETFDNLWEQQPKLSKEEWQPENEILISSNGADKGGDEEFKCIRDSAGYVLAMNYRGEWVAGEELRYALFLPSSNFQVLCENETITFEVTGEGHGMGMSQFTANEMAKEGADFLSILKYFFKGTELTKIEK